MKIIFGFLFAGSLILSLIGKGDMDRKNETEQSRGRTQYNLGVGLAILFFICWAIAE